MSTRLSGLLALAAVLCFLSCKDEDSIPAELQPYLGEYAVQYDHQYGLVPIFDSLGNIEYEERFANFADSLLTIEYIGNDSLSINALPKGWNTGFPQEVRAVLQDDTLRIFFEKNEFVRNNYVRGDIWLVGDSLFLDYRWNTSDTYNIEAPPEYGELQGRGERL